MATLRFLHDKKCPLDVQDKVEKQVLPLCTSHTHMEKHTLTTTHHALLSVSNYSLPPTHKPLEKHYFEMPRNKHTHTHTALHIHTLTFPHLWRKPVTLAFYQLICCCYGNRPCRERWDWCVCVCMCVCVCVLSMLVQPRRALPGRPKSQKRFPVSPIFTRCPFLSANAEAEPNLRCTRSADYSPAPVQASLKFHLSLLHNKPQITSRGVCVELDNCFVRTEKPKDLSGLS